MRSLRNIPQPLLNYFDAGRAERRYAHRVVTGLSRTGASAVSAGVPSSPRAAAGSTRATFGAPREVYS